MSRDPLFVVASVIAVLLAAVVFQNCEMAQPNMLVDSDGWASSSTPTPTPDPDGVRYVLAGWTCGGTDLLAPAQETFSVRSLFMNIASSAVYRSTLYLSSCTRTETFYQAYPSSTSIILTQGPTTCSSSCNSIECYDIGTPNPAVTTAYVMAQTSSSLTLSRVLTSVETNDSSAVYKQAECEPGQTEILTYVRQ